MAGSTLLYQGIQQGRPRRTTCQASQQQQGPGKVVALTLVGKLACPKRRLMYLESFLSKVGAYRAEPRRMSMKAAADASPPVARTNPRDALNASCAAGNKAEQRVRLPASLLVSGMLAQAVVSAIVHMGVKHGCWSLSEVWAWVERGSSHGIPGHGRA
jgi:hypothetical protein